MECFRLLLEHLAWNRASIFEWHKWFKEGRESVRDDETLQNNPSRKLSKLVKPDMRDTAGKVRTNSWAIYIRWSPSHGRINIQQLFVLWRTSRERWTREAGSERGSGRSVLAARHDDDCTMKKSKKKKKKKKIKEDKNKPKWRRFGLIHWMDHMSNLTQLLPSLN